MTGRLFLALACFLAIAGCSGGEPVRSPDGDANPLIYEIANADGETEGWMLGTIHALPDDTRWRTPAIERAFDQADSLIVEVAELEDQSAISSSFSRLATTPGLGPLPPRIDPQLRPELARMIRAAGIAPEQFDATETWAAAIMLSRVGASGNPRNGVDRYAISRFAGREISGFESADEQLGVFDALPLRDQRDLLEGTVREWALAREDPGWLSRAWLAGDLEVLERATTSGIMADAELREALLVGRNRRWLPVLVEVLEGTKRPLVAVGTGHLIGSDGLVAMLEAQGFTVTRLD